MRQALRKKLMLLLAAMLLGTVTAAAQTDDEQVLVFRNTGEVNLLYASEIDSIVCSRMDADSVMHDNVVAQVFYTADTALVVPVAEIDSVTFGSRNSMAVKVGVRMMTAADSTWIIRYDGDNIYYRHDTPADILPHEGEKLFYGKTDRLFPIGLMAVVNSVRPANGEYAVNISDAEPAELFDRLFWAGRIEEAVAQQSAAGGMRRTPVDKNRTLELSLGIGDNWAIKGKDEFGISGKVVANALTGFFSMEADVSNDFELSLAAKIEKDDEITEEHNISTLPLGVYALVFTPELKFDAFATIKAELSANLRYLRTTNVHISYLHERWGKDAVMNVTGLKGEDNGTRSQVDVTCKGEFYAGVRAGFDFNILREATGARLSLSLGPSFEGEFGLGMLQKADQYDPELYSKAELNTSIKLLAEGELYVRDKLLWGKDKIYPMFSYEQKFLKTTLNLFPMFTQTRAVSVPEKERQTVTMATKSGNNILQDVQTGFRIETEQGDVVDSIFVDTIASGTETVQGVSAEIDITGKVAPEARKTLVVRPVFHYAGYTVAARHATLMSDMMLQPMVFGQTNGAVTYLSGIPFSGSTVKDSTLYMAGPYLPVAVRDTVFNKPAPIGSGIFIDDVLEARLIGTWSGTEAGANVTYVFNADGTGRMTGTSSAPSPTPFSYVLNSPQSGRILLQPDGDGGKTKVLSVVNISESVLQYRIPGGTALYTLNRQ